jgi:hypothetical protein
MLMTRMYELMEKQMKNEDNKFVVLDKILETMEQKVTQTASVADNATNKLIIVDELGNEMPYVFEAK